MEIKKSEIKGTTKVVGLIGYPVSHSLSPLMHNTAFKKAGIDWIYAPFPVHPDSLEDAIKGLAALGIIGVNVTIPHKENVIQYLDEISDEAELIGAVNTIKVRTDETLYGANTDAIGFRTALEKDGGFEIAGKKIAIIGAGGVAKAIAVVCALSGAEKIILTDIVEEKCDAIIKIIKKANKKIKSAYYKSGDAELGQAIKGSDLIVNATPVGMRSNDGSPIPTAWLPDKGFVFDTIYNPTETPLLKSSKQKGLKTQNGILMLLYQGAAAFEIWTGIKPDIKVMKEALFSSEK